MIHLISIGLGLILGSFFNVLIWRLPRDESIISPSSHCPHCLKSIRPWENIPVISFLVLNGKCSNCKNPISFTYPLIEISTAVLSILLAITLFYDFAHSMSWSDAPAYIVKYLFLLSMLPVAVIDAKHFIIPDLFTIPPIILGVIISFFPGETSPLQSITGIILGGGILYMMGWIGTRVLKKGEAMGFGDVKLMAAAGAIFGVKISLLAIVFGAFLGSAIGITLIAFKKLSADHHIPFGPFLGTGLWLAVLAGDTIITTYYNFLSKLTSFQP